MSEPGPAAAVRHRGLLQSGWGTDDATRCAGGRQLDYAPSGLHMLPAVVAAVRGCGSSIPVLVDGGVRRGTDVIKVWRRRACFCGKSVW